MRQTGRWTEFERMIQTGLSPFQNPQLRHVPCLLCLVCRLYIIRTDRQRDRYTELLYGIVLCIHE